MNSLLDHFDDLRMLPGLKRKLDQAEQIIRDGNSLVLVVPEMAPAWFVGMLKRRFQDGQDWSVLDVSQGRPMKLLFEAFGEDLPSGTVRSLETIVGHGGFQGKIIEIANVVPEHWCQDRPGDPGWMKLLRDHANLNRGIPSYARSQFLVLLNETASLKRPVRDAMLKVEEWQDWCTLTDAFVYYHVIADTPPLSMRPLAQMLKAAICSELSLWDFQLCEALSGRDLKELMNLEKVKTILGEYGRGLGFDRIDPEANVEAKWNAGAAEKINGSWMEHSAYLALIDPVKLEKRLWRAELTVLFPHVEEQKNALLERFGKNIRLPHYDPARREPIVSLHDLDIGNVYYIFQQQRLFSSEAENYAFRLKAVRDDLAHGRAIKYFDFESILSPPAF